MFLYGMTTFQDVDDDDAQCEICGERWRKLFFVVLFSIGGTGYAMGDLCPECGEAAVVNEEGCRKCYACAFSEC